MSFLARSRKLQCFYCGNWTPKPAQKGSLRSVRCEHCEAVNHFDAKGKITDPPAALGNHGIPSRYAHDPRQRSPSPSASGSFSASESIFCNTCLKNQHILNENKASVQPPAEGSAHHAQYLANLEALEQRYPQVCEECRPRAKAAILRANYTAKADNLRRTMENTRSQKASSYGHQGRVWRNLLLKAAGMGWFMSVFAQIIWHSLGARIDGRDSGLQDEELRIDESRSVITLLSCLRSNIFERVVNVKCFEQADDWMPQVLLLSFSTIWWNIKLQRKYLGLGGRMIGTRDYYIIQVFTLLVRTAAWWLLSTSSPTPLNDTISRRTHTFMAVLLLFISTRSLTVVKIDHRPRVFYRRDNANDILPTPVSRTRQQPVDSSLEFDMSKASGFNGSTRPRLDIGAFAGKTERSPRSPVLQEPSRWAAPYLMSGATNQRNGDQTPVTTPTARSRPSIAQNSQTANSPLTPGGSPGPEPMDWSPSLPSSFAINANLQPSNDRYSLRSRLPAKNNPQHIRSNTSTAAHARQNAYTKSNGNGVASNGFASLGLGEKRGRPRGRKFDDASTVTSIDDEVATEVDETEYDQTTQVNELSKRKKGIDFHMQPTRLWLNEDRVETGLEDMFNQVFSIGGAKDNSDDEDDEDYGNGNDISNKSGVHGRSNRKLERKRAKSSSSNAAGSGLAILLAVAVSMGVIGAVAIGVRKWKSGNWERVVGL